MQRKKRIMHQFCPRQPNGANEIARRQQIQSLLHFMRCWIETMRSPCWESCSSATPTLSEMSEYCFKLLGCLLLGRNRASLG